MNFIIRNLGWVLLIIFFIFMLYLISSQNNVKQMNLVNTGSIVDTKIISGESNIDNTKIVVEKYNSEKNKISAEIAIDEKTTVEDENGIIDTVKDFFAFDDDTNKKIVLENKNISTGEIDQVKIEKEVKEEKSTTKETKKEEIKTIVKKDIVVKEEKKEISVSDKIKEKIKKRNKELHTVGVKAIALNNAYFTKRIGYAYKGDKLEQLTNTNRYGCFNSEVVESKKSMGEKGWTCIYYMEGHLNEISKYQKESINYYKKLRNKRIIKKRVQNKIKISNKTKTKANKYPLVEKRADGSTIITKDPHRVYEGPTYNTEVGSLYLVRVNSLKLNNKTFTTKNGTLEACTQKKCDVLEQLTPVDKNGCFKVNVFMSKTNKNQRGWVCQKYLR